MLINPSSCRKRTRCKSTNILNRNFFYLKKKTKQKTLFFTCTRCQETRFRKIQIFLSNRKIFNYCLIFQQFPKYLIQYKSYLNIIYFTCKIIEYDMHTRCRPNPHLYITLAQSCNYQIIFYSTS